MKSQSDQRDDSHYLLVELHDETPLWVAYPLLFAIRALEWLSERHAP